MNTLNSAYLAVQSLSGGLVVLMAITTFALVGCEGPVGPEGPEGPEGPRGEQGERGPAGSANVTSETFTLQAADFSVSTSDLTTTLTHPIEVSSLSSSIVTNGIVLVYIEYALGGAAGVWQPVPFTDDYEFGDGTAAILNFRFVIPESDTVFETGNTALVVEALRVLSSTNADNIASDLDGARLRVVTVPPSTASSAGVSQEMRYSDAMSRLEKKSRLEKR